MLNKILAARKTRKSNKTVLKETISSGQQVVFLNYDRVNAVSRDDRTRLPSFSLQELLDKKFLLRGTFSKMRDDLLAEVVVKDEEKKTITQCVFYKDMFPLDEKQTDLLRNLVRAAVNDRLPDDSL